MAISAASIYMLSTQTALDEAFRAASLASPMGLAAAAGLILVSVLAKALRWKVLLGGGSLRISTLTGASLVGYLFSTVLPLRAGEIVRAAVIRQLEGKPISTSLASIVVEKLFDIGVLFGFLVAVALVAPIPSWVAMGSVTASAIFIFLGATLIALPRLQERLHSHLFSAVPPPGQVIVRWIAAFVHGLQVTVTDPRSLMLSLALSVVAWGAGALTIWLALTSVNLPVPLWAAVLVMVVTNLGMAIPSAPGYMGVYHYLVVLSLSTYGVEMEKGLAAALVLHLLVFGTLALLGILAVLLMGVSLRQLSGEISAGSSSQKA